MKIVRRKMSPQEELVLYTRDIVSSNGHEEYLQEKLSRLDVAAAVADLRMGKFLCFVCTEKNSSMKKLRQHLVIHFQKRLEAELGSAFENIVKYPSPCLECETIYSSPEYLIQHLSVKHGYMFNLLPPEFAEALGFPSRTRCQEMKEKEKVYHFYTGLVFMHFLKSFNLPVFNDRL
jgi:hypothetical protein